MHVSEGTVWPYLPDSSECQDIQARPDNLQAQKGLLSLASYLLTSIAWRWSDSGLNRIESDYHARYVGL